MTLFVSPAILIVEDEVKIARLLSDYFENEGFNVFILDRGDAVLPFLGHTKIDVILLDIMLPGMDGRQILTQIRQTSNIPVIMLTAKIEESDILKGFDLGADDYIRKPFSPKVVVARVKNVLKRSRRDVFSNEIRVSSLCLNLNSHEVSINEDKLPVTPNEYGILRALMMEPDRVFSRQELVSIVQGYEFEGYHRTIDTHIKNLRKKISESLPDEKVIFSVYGKGYKINPDF